MDGHIVLACAAVGVVTEATSSILGLWQYRRPWLRAGSVVVVFAVAFGALCTAVAGEPIWLRFAAGAGAGVVYEAANLQFLHMFSFPNGRLLFLRGRPALILGAGVSWGVLPVLAPVIARLL